jgi:hypothetical protein
MAAKLSKVASFFAAPSPILSAFEDLAICLEITQTSNGYIAKSRIARWSIEEIQDELQPETQAIMPNVHFRLSANHWKCRMVRRDGLYKIHSGKSPTYRLHWTSVGRCICGTQSFLLPGLWCKDPLCLDVRISQGAVTSPAYQRYDFRQSTAAERNSLRRFF